MQRFNFLSLEVLKKNFNNLVYIELKKHAQKMIDAEIQKRKTAIEKKAKDQLSTEEFKKMSVEDQTAQSNMINDAAKKDIGALSTEESQRHIFDESLEIQQAAFAQLSVVRQQQLLVINKLFAYPGSDLNNETRVKYITAELQNIYNEIDLSYKGINSILGSPKNSTLWTHIPTTIGITEQNQLDQETIKDLETLSKSKEMLALKKSFIFDKDLAAKKSSLAKITQVLFMPTLKSKDPIKAGPDEEEAINNKDSLNKIEELKKNLGFQRAVENYSVQESKKLDKFYEDRKASLNNGWFNNPAYLQDNDKRIHSLKQLREMAATSEKGWVQDESGKYVPKMKK